MRDLNCLRCGRQMRYIKREKLQLGQTGWVLGDLPNLFAGAMSVDIYTCPGCGKVEFYLADAAEEELPQKQCPNSLYRSGIPRYGHRGKMDHQQ